MERVEPPVQTAHQIGHRWQPPYQLASDGVLVRTKYETLPDHLNDLAVSEIVSSDRFLSTAAESYTFKRRDRCLNGSPIYSPAPPSGSVEQRLQRASPPPRRSQRSAGGETAAPRRHCNASAAALPRPSCPRRRPAADPLPRHLYTATSGVAAELNPYLSTTSKDFQPKGSAARRYRDAPLSDHFIGDRVLPDEAAPQPRWHGFQPAVPHAGLSTEVMRRFRPPRLDWCSRHNWTTPAEAPLAVPPTTRQLMGEAQFERESDNYGTGRHNSVALGCGGLAGCRSSANTSCEPTTDGI